jgi:dipeptidyl aminopeptidase/acylaminoacyl peptidase
VSNYLIHLHDGPSAQFRPVFNRIHQYLSARGFQILAPNVRGSTGYGKDFTNLDNFRNRDLALSDVLETARVLSQQKPAPTRIAVFGEGYGGYLAARAAQVKETPIQALASLNGIVDIKAFILSSPPFDQPALEKEYGPLSEETFLASISPLPSIGKMSTPALWIYPSGKERMLSSEDSNNPSGRPEILTVTEKAADLTRPSSQMQYAQKLAHFFEKHLRSKSFP